MWETEIITNTNCTIRSFSNPTKKGVISLSTYLHVAHLFDCVLIWLKKQKKNSNWNWIRENKCNSRWSFFSYFSGVCCFCYHSLEMVEKCFSLCFLGKRQSSKVPKIKYHCRIPNMAYIERMMLISFHRTGSAQSKTFPDFIDN